MQGRDKAGCRRNLIHDFLDDLTWELRIGYFQNTTPGGTVHSGLADQSKKYQKKYKVTSRYRHIVVGLKASVPF